MEVHQTLLVSELDKRKRKNSNFSLRAFARILDMSPTHLSLLINGRKNLTRKQAVKIAEKLNLSPLEAQKMLGATVLDKTKSTSKNQEQRLLSEDEFRLISDWYHLAILSLGELKNNRADSKWIAKRLGITFIQALDAFKRLQRLGFIEIKNGRFKQIVNPLQYASNKPSSAIRKYHNQNLELAREKMESVALDWREISSITMAANLQKIEKVKKMINEFKQQVCQELEQGTLEEVYTLSIQLFPNTLIGEGK